MNASERETVAGLAQEIASDALLLSHAMCELGEEHVDVIAFCRAAIAVVEAGKRRELTAVHALVLAVAIQAVADARAERLWETISE